MWLASSDQSSPAQSTPTLPCPALPCPALPFSAPLCRALPYTALACPALTMHRSALPCPATPCRTMPDNARQCPVIPQVAISNKTCTDIGCRIRRRAAAEDPARGMPAEIIPDRLGRSMANVSAGSSWPILACLPHYGTSFVYEDAQPQTMS